MNYRDLLDTLSLALTGLAMNGTLAAENKTAGKPSVPRMILRLAGCRALRELVARMAAACGVLILRHDRLPACTANLLSIACEGLLRNHPHPRFVQVGANDGVDSDPLHGLIVRHGMSGVLIEPLPDVFQRLVVNYQSVPNLAFENVAITDSDGETVLFMPQTANSEGISTLASLDRNHAAFGSLAVTSVPVRTMTMATLFRKHGIDSLDVLQVDVEGRDLRVVKAALATGLRPRIIHFENHHLTPDEKIESRDVLREAGYQYVENMHDTLALHGEVS